MWYSYVVISIPRLQCAINLAPFIAKEISDILSQDGTRMKRFLKAIKKKKVAIALIGLVGALLVLVAGQHCDLQRFFSAMLPMHAHQSHTCCDSSPSQSSSTGEICCVPSQGVPGASVEAKLVLTIPQVALLPRPIDLLSEIPIIDIGIFNADRSLSPPQKIWISFLISRAPPSA